MKIQHWIGAVVLLVMGYYIGTNYPQFWTKLGIGG
jgi:Ni,Fe-hydrogenase I cytochrome b subunit